ncbi:MAG: class I SAM-dependent methyltransferase [Sulfuricellaceae bacterium]
MISKPPICLVCGSSNWKDLIDPHDSRSVTTAGRVVAKPLGKSQCMTCGAAQRVRSSMLAFTDYYETDYANYYERPGAETFHKQRYVSIWKWICEAVAIKEPKRILDVGCGQGWLMDLMQETFPEAVIEGIEPSQYNVKMARERGHRVHEGRLEHIAPALASFDLVVSTNVLQHVSNPLDFLTTLSKLVSGMGVTVVTCPDGSRPNIELLWADQNLSLIPANLQSLAGKALPNSQSCTICQSEGSSASLPPALLMISDSSCGKKQNDFHCDIDLLLQERQKFLGSFRAIDKFLTEQVKESSNVVNLGASYWSSILAAYCPNYWSLVQSCCVDDPKDQTTFLDKPVVKTSDVPDTACVVLGITPDAQQRAANSISQRFLQVISWGRLLCEGNLGK